jgi:transcriptional regulator GlxA family with amidase domain
MDLAQGCGHADPAVALRPRAGPCSSATELRLQKARGLLADPRHDLLKVSDIALACGFNEVSYFNRRFGASPTQHRGR